MGIRPSFNKTKGQSGACSVDKYINTAYDEMKALYDNLDELLEVSEQLPYLMKYLGAYDEPPTERPDGTPLQDGDYYFDSTSNALIYYNEGSNSWFEVDPAAVLDAAERAETAASDADSSALAASDSAAAAKVSEDNAALSEANADADATQTAIDAADTAADAAQTAADAVTTTTNANSAANSEAAALIYRNDAEQSALRAEAAFDSFNDQYLGAKNSHPTEDNDGDPLQPGMTYWNIPEETLYYWNGAIWESPDKSASDSAANALASANSASTSASSAAASAATATTKASEANTSATNAAASESAAELSEINAEVSETNAANSELNAAASETAARQSELASASSESNAAASESAASASELAAASSEANAYISEINAKASEDQAKIYVDSLANGVNFKGDWDASSGAFPTPSMEPETADYYIITVAGTMTDGAQPDISVEVGDTLMWHTENDEWFRVARAYNHGHDDLYYPRGEAEATFVERSGSSMTGPLLLAAEPVDNFEPVNYGLHQTEIDRLDARINNLDPNGIPVDVALKVAFEGVTDENGEVEVDGGYQVGFTRVLINGVKIKDTDVIATDGTTVKLGAEFAFQDITVEHLMDSDDVATQTWANENLVKVTGNQDVDGVKTFKQDLIGNKSTGEAIFRSSTNPNAQLRMTANGAAVLSAESETVYLRPNSTTSTAGQMTVSTGGNVAVSGTISVLDGKAINFGTGEDGKINHSGSEWVIANSSGPTRIRNIVNGTGINLQLTGSDSNLDNVIVAANSGTSTWAELYFNGARKLNTTTSGANIEGTLNVDDIIVGSAGSDSRMYHTEYSEAQLRFNSAGATILSSEAETIYLRPNASTSSGGEFLIATDGTTNAQGTMILRNPVGIVRKNDDTGAIQLASGTAASSNNGAYITAYANNYGGSDAGQLTLVSGNGSTGKVRTPSEFHIDSSKRQWRVTALPNFSFGQSNITDEYLVLNPIYDDGAAHSVTNIMGYIEFSRGGLTSGNAISRTEVFAQTSYIDVETCVARMLGGNQVAWIGIHIIEIDGQRYYALKGNTSGGGNINNMQFIGSFFDNAFGDSTKSLTRVRESDSNVTVIDTNWGDVHDGRAENNVTRFGWQGTTGDAFLYDNAGSGNFSIDLEAGKTYIRSTQADPLTIRRDSGTTGQNCSIRFDTVTDVFIGVNPTNSFCVGTSLDQSNAPFQIDASVGAVTAGSVVVAGSAGNGGIAGDGRIYQNASQGAAGTHLTRKDYVDSNFAPASDERIKSDIKLNEDVLDAIMSLRSVNYIKDGEHEHGLIAQDVQKILPDQITEIDDTLRIKSNHFGLISMLVGAVQELKAEVEELKKEIK